MTQLNHPIELRSGRSADGLLLSRHTIATRGAHGGFKTRENRGASVRSRVNRIRINPHGPAFLPEPGLHGNWSSNDGAHGRRGHKMFSHVDDSERWRMNLDLRGRLGAVLTDLDRSPPR